MTSFSKSVWFYALFGACFGALFPILALFMTIREQDMTWSLQNIKLLHQNNSLFFIIDSAPLVLGAVFAVIGVFTKNQIEYLATLSELERNLRDNYYNASHKFTLRKLRITYVSLFFVVGTMIVGGLFLVMNNCYHDTNKLNLFREVQSMYGILGDSSVDAPEQMQHEYKRISSLYNLNAYPEIKTELDLLYAQSLEATSFTGVDYNAALANMSAFHVDFYKQHKENQMFVSVSCGVLVLVIISLLVFTHFYFFAPNFLLLQKAIIENTAARHLIQKQANELQLAKDENDEILKQLRLNLSTAEHIRDVLKVYKKPLPEIFGEVFHIDKPMQTLSGDYIWYNERSKDVKTMILGDCVGHGVAGTLLSTLYEEFIEQIEPLGLSPDAFIVELDDRIKSHLSHLDGLDQFTCEVGVVVLDKSKKKAWFSGSNTDLIVVNGKCETYKSQRFSIGSYKNQERPFCYEIDLHAGDWLVMYSDGYKNLINNQHQRMGITNAHNLLLQCKSDSGEQYQVQLENEINSFLSGAKSYDDMTIVGIKIPE
ncbi:MAG: SpoIIE family protein phosphatase [Cryomorphaceae bacterium]|nr:SpoIIE family protein phosphatase [Cryomorphaceae bacterium]